MKSRSRATLFLIEQIIVVGIFALCAAACARIFTSAYFQSKESKDVRYAIIAAESCAESYKASGGNLGQVAQALGGATGIVGGSDAAIVHYDSQWLITSGDDASFRLVIVNGAQDSGSALLIAELSVENLADENTGVILSFPVIVQQGGAY